MTEIEKIFGEKTRTLFGEVRFEDIDIEKHSKYIIERVLDYGDFSELRKLFKFYGRKRVKKVVKTSRALSKKAKIFWGKIFAIEDDPQWQKSLKIHSEFWIR